MLYLLRRTPVKTLKHLPKFLPIDEDFKNTALICDDEHEKLRLAILDVKNQFFVESATWGLSDWERVLNISVKENSSIEDRRRQILLKLQGANIVSEAFMNNLINMFCKDNSGYIIQHNKEYYFEVVLNGNQKLDLDGLYDAIELYKPAHLGYIYSVKVNINTNRYIGSKIGVLRTYHLEPKMIENTSINENRYNLGKITNIKYIDIDMSGIMSEVSIDNKKYMLATPGQLRETNLTIDNFIKPVQFDIKLNHTKTFDLFKRNTLNLNFMKEITVKAKNKALAKTTNLKEFSLKLKEEQPNE